MLTNKFVLHFGGGGWLNMALAFLKISRSIRNRSFSWCKWRSSSSEAVWWPLLGKASLPLAANFLLQAYRTFSEIPNSWAI
jgi:hypothetical protein